MGVMHFEAINKNSEEELVSLFVSVFSESEGVEEGARIGDLVSRLSRRIDDKNIICLGAYEQEQLVAAIFFSRLGVANPIQVYMLSPVAVSTPHQGKGIGQSIINYGLNDLKSRSVSVVVTYGDPSFYSKAGFRALSENVMQAPFQLSIPEGWLGQCLSGEALPVIEGRPTCVEEFNDPAYW